MAEQVRCGVMFETPAELQAAVSARLASGEFFVPYPDEVADGSEAAVDVLLESGARVELLGIVKGPDFDERGNTGLVVLLTDESATTLKAFVEAVVTPTESSPSGLFGTTRFTRPKTLRTVDGKPVAVPDGEEPLLEPGTLLEERFRIEAHIASGGMGEVYRAAHVHLKRPVALKLLKRVLASDPEMWNRFQREAELVSQLENPHIVRVFDFGRTQSGQPFLAMEYVEGTALDAEVAKGPLEPRRVVEILKQVCDGLAEAHQLGIVHRDLKPPNIVLGKKRDGTELAKILDFGIARAADKGQAADGKLTQLGMVVGTPMYLAPEQALAGALDERTDIYALGCVAYELLTGKPPFLADELSKVISMHLTQVPDELTTRRPQLAAYKPLTDVVLKALAKNKSDRFANVAEFKEALSAAVATAPALEAAAEEVWPPAPPPSAPRAVPPTPAPTAAPPSASTEADDFFSSKSGPGTPGQPPAAVPTKSPRRARLEAVGLPVAPAVLDDLASSREDFGVTGNRLIVVHLEVLGASVRSPRALRCTARALMVSRAWGAVVDTIDDDRVVLLFSGEALTTTARMATALLAIRDAVTDEATRQPDAGPASVRAAAVQGSTRTDLSHEIDERVTRKAQVLAARLSAGSIVLEKQLAAECADVVEQRPLDQVDGCEVVSRRSRLALNANVPALVGRDSILQLLDKRVASLSAGVVAPVLVRAPRGSGRSSLVAEVSSRARSKGAVVGVARSPAALRDTPFGAITELVCAVVGVPVESRTTALRPALERLSLQESTLTAMLVICGVMQLPHPFTAGQAAHALRAVLRAGAAGRPVLLLFDGLEAFDGPSIETFRELVGRAAPKELTIGFVDPEVPIDRLGSVPAVDLTGLTRADIGLWLNAVLALPPSAELIERLFTLSQGVPGRLVDLTWWLHDRALLRQQANQTTVLGDVPALDGEAISRARLGAMPLELARLLEAAALCGDTFEGSQVSIAMPRVTPQILQAALQGRLLKGAGTRRWAFGSSRLHRLVLDLPSPERTFMHQRLAAALIEQARASPNSIDSVRLANHLNAAGDGLRAGALWRHAAESALSRRAIRDAITAVRGWVDALAQTVPMTSEVVRARVDALARASGMALSLQDAALARALVDEAIAMQQGKDFGSPELSLSLARVHRSEARRARAAEALDAAERRAGDTPFLALVDAERAEAREQEGDLPAAVLAWESSLQRSAAAEELARWHGEINLTARVEARLAGAKLMRKEAGGARALLESSLARWRTTNWPSAEARVLANLGTLCVQTNQLAEAIKHFDSAAIAAAASGDLLFQAKMVLQQARVSKRHGQLPQSKQLAQKARTLSADVGWEEGRLQAEAV